MHKSRCITLLALFGVLFSLNARAQESTTAYNFLRLPVSAHAAALGGGGTEIIDDDAALIFSNPALLASVADRTINLNYMNYMQGAKTLSATFTRMVNDKASWGVSGQFLDYGTMRHTDADNTNLGDFSARDIALAGHFSYMLSEKISGGITTRIITSYIGEYSSMAMAFDLGLNYYNPDNDLSVSLVAKNLGGQIDAYDDDYEKIPFELQAGLGKRLGESPLTVHAAFENLQTWREPLIRHLALGAQFDLGNSIWVGGGYNFRRKHEMVTADTDKPSSHGAGLSLGAGLTLQRFSLQLAYGKYHVSSTSLLINLGYKL